MRRLAQIGLLACFSTLAGAALAFDNGQYENVPADIRAWSAKPWCGMCATAAPS